MKYIKTYIDKIRSYNHSLYERASDQGKEIPYTPKENEPQIGDYIKIYVPRLQREATNFFEKNIGQVIDMCKVKYSYRYEKVITIGFNKEVIPNDFIYDGFFEKDKDSNKYIRSFYLNDIDIVFGKTEEEVKLKLDANKYNL